MLVKVVDADLIVKDGVKTDVAEIRNRFHCSEIVAVALAQREDGAARAEHAFPEMRERRRVSLRINVDGLLCEGRRIESEERHEDDKGVKGFELPHEGLHWLRRKNSAAERGWALIDLDCAKHDNAARRRH